MYFLINGNCYGFLDVCLFLLNIRAHLGSFFWLTTLFLYTVVMVSDKKNWFSWNSESGSLILNLKFHFFWNSKTYCKVIKNSQVQFEIDVTKRGFIKCQVKCLVCLLIIITLKGNLWTSEHFWKNYVIAKSSMESLYMLKTSLGKWLPNLIKSVWCLPMLIVRIFHYIPKHFVLFLNIASCSRCNILWEQLFVILWCIIKSFQWWNSYARFFLWVLSNLCMFS